MLLYNKTKIAHEHSIGTLMGFSIVRIYFSGIFSTCPV